MIKTFSAIDFARNLWNLWGHHQFHQYVSISVRVRQLPYMSWTTYTSLWVYWVSYLYQSTISFTIKPKNCTSEATLSFHYCFRYPLKMASQSPSTGAPLPSDSKDSRPYLWFIHSLGGFFTLNRHLKEQSAVLGHENSFAVQDSSGSSIKLNDTWILWEQVVPQNNRAYGAKYECNLKEIAKFDCVQVNFPPGIFLFFM